MCSPSSSDGMPLILTAMDIQAPPIDQPPTTRWRGRDFALVMLAGLVARWSDLRGGIWRLVGATRSCS